MKICIFGNSHLASLKLGWDDLKSSYPDVELIFFGSPNDTLRELDIDNGRLVPNNPVLAEKLKHTSGGREFVQPAEFDAFLLYGNFIPPRDLSIVLSRAVMTATAIDRFHQSVTWRLARQISTLSRAPIYASPEPASARSNIAERFSAFYSYVDVMTALIAGLAAEQLTLIAQPAETMSNAWSTRESFTKNSVRLATNELRGDVPHGERDYRHMNAEYGALYLKNFFEICGARQTVTAR